jgi:hypothetical protein
VVALKTAQIVALTADQIVALSTDDIVALTTTQFAAMHTDQLQALTMGQVGAMLVAQTNALTTTQQSYLTTASPLILDLNGDGVQTLSYTAGVAFDVFAKGTSTTTGWVSSSDGLLVLDRNADGLITDGSELFGTATRLADGSQAPNGYAALRQFDSNGDGDINSQDSIYADLRVWVDANSDGISQTGELKSLRAAGVASIGLQDTAALSKNNGNLVGLSATYQTTDGATRATADVWFVADKAASTGTVVATVDNAIAALKPAAPPSAGPTQYARVRDSDLPAPMAVPAAVSNPRPWDQPAAGATVPSPVAPTEEAKLSAIRSSVSHLAQAMGSFDALNAAARDQTASQTPASPTQAPAPSAAALTVASMVDVMKRFDNNGNALFATNSGAAAVGKSITLPGLQDPAKNGMLASPAA